MKKTNIEIYIEELDLLGFAPGDRFAISESVQYELERLFATGPAEALPAVNASSDLLDAGSFTAAFGSRPATIGGKIAKSLYHAIVPPDGGSK